LFIASVFENDLCDEPVMTPWNGIDLL